MSDRLLGDTDKKERLSEIYVKALAVEAGYLTSVPKPDRDSVDLRILAGGPQRPALDLQLKATSKLLHNGDNEFRFRLPIKNYRELGISTQTPRLLVVLDLPENESEWMTITLEALVLRRCAYWIKLNDTSEDKLDQHTVTIDIPKKNVLDVNTLKDLMNKSRLGQL